jgi:N-carbamoyl-L-amino-acid hydrolase
LARQHIVPPRTVKLFVLRGEESAWFGRSWIGSRALFGLLTPEDLAQRRMDTGRRLREYLADTGADVAAIEAQQPLLTPANVAAFLEVHIEQGPVLDALDVPLGVVTGIHGNLRHRRIVCRGEAAHAGATPRDLRHDAVVALADFIMRIDRHWADCLARGQQLVVTHGIVGTNEREHAISRVPGEATTSLEIRADDKAALAGFHGVVLNEANNVSSERGVDFAFDVPIVNGPARMDAGWTRRLEQLCETSGIAHKLLASGAGHDAAIFAHVGIPTAMLFIRNRYGSHNPREHVSLEDFVLAARVLMRALTLDAD